MAIYEHQLRYIKISTKIPEILEYIKYTTSEHLQYHEPIEQESTRLTPKQMLQSLPIPLP